MSDKSDVTVYLSHDMHCTCIRMCIISCSPDDMMKILDNCKVPKRCSKPLKKALKTLADTVSSTCVCHCRPA